MLMGGVVSGCAHVLYAAGVSAMEGRGKKKPIRKVLTLKEKVAVVDYVKKNPGTGSRKVADCI